MLVTASVDAIHMRHQLSMDNDMMVDGRVYAAPLLCLTCTHEEPLLLYTRVNVGLLGGRLLTTC